MELREKLRPYTRTLMRKAHEKGAPVMRTMFYEYPEDPICWEVEDEYFYGSDFLVAPVFEAGARMRKVYLPKGAVWVDWRTGEEYDGGQWMETNAPLEWMPLFIKKKDK